MDCRKAPKQNTHVDLYDYHSCTRVRYPPSPLVRPLRGVFRCFCFKYLYNADDMKPKAPNPKKILRQFMAHIISLIILIVCVGFLYAGLSYSKKRQAAEAISVSQVAQLVKEGQVKTMTLRGEKIALVLQDDSEKTAKKENDASLSETLVAYGVTPIQLQVVDFEVQNDHGFGYIFLNILPILAPILFFVILIWFLSGQMKGGGMKAFSFGQSRARVTDPDKQNVTFDDVAGNEVAKIELAEVVDFLKNPKKFLDIGATIPKGVLLMGAPGTGKTLLARAVAGEAKVPFFHLSGSEFVEMFVGVGASRVRDLFDQAKAAAPAIIFIDEIDAVGRHRGVGIGGGNDEREQTLNQILVEMDGFEPTEKIIVIAATNRSDVLDPALLRPGRFDRRVILDLPDRKERVAILQVHAKKKQLGDDINLEVIAERTPGFSGADLQSLMNEAAILAARDNRKKISQQDIVRSIEKVMIGPERKSHLHNPKERKIVAYHEAGHAILASLLEHADPVHKVSIVARGYTGGFTMKLPIEERKLQSRNEFLDDIVVSMGGYVAEKTVFGDITTGPSNDLQVASRMAYSMVTRWGMSEKIGPIALETSDGSSISEHGSAFNNHTGTIIAEEVSKIIHESLARAQKLIQDNRQILDAIAEKLLEQETIEQDEYNTIIERFGVIAKKRSIDTA